MKKLVTLLAIVGLIALGGNAFGVMNTMDTVPAATMLLPYFQVDLANADGVNTLFSINNASAAPQLAHVTVWSQWSIPVLDFDVYLTGFDVQTISMRDILVNGMLPVTGYAVSNQGAYSFANVPFPSCNNTTSPPLPPVYSSPAISASFLAHLQALLTGQASPIDGSCAGPDNGDSIARGYITIDDVSDCNQLYPSDSNYFLAGGQGIATDNNVLWGDYFYVDSANNFAQGNNLIAVEAFPGQYTQGDYTFYGRYVSGSGIDDREPLATTFGVRYLNGGAFDGGTHLQVWRDSKYAPGATCAGGPNYLSDSHADAYGMTAAQIVVFDEDENPYTVVTGGPSGEPTPSSHCVFCDESQSVQVGGTLLDTGGYNFGWLYLNLNWASDNDATLGAGYTGIQQNWVTATHSALGRFSVGLNAVQLMNAAYEVPLGTKLGPPQ